MDKFALTLSFLSIIIAGVALGWNIYRDVILKPQLVVSFTVESVFSDHKESTHISLKGVNGGPGKITCNSVTLKQSSLFRKFTKRINFWAVLPDFQNPHCTNLPVTLNMADEVKLVFPYEKGCFLNRSFTHIGLNDSFNRVHWCPVNEVSVAKKLYNSEFCSKLNA